MSQTSQSLRLALIAASIAVLVAVAPLGSGSRRPTRLNVILFVTDDQTLDTLPHDPPVMPYLQGRMEDPNDHWISFANAFIDAPLCCPSRASILSGRYPQYTDVYDNTQGGRFRASDTLATWLRAAGYYTGLFGKYLNLYPFGRGPFVPPGWDRWAGKVQREPGRIYYDGTLVLDGLPVRFGSAPADYLTDVLAGLAADFIRTAPADRPFFLMFAPTGPHGPWTPAPRDVGTYPQAPPQPPAVNEADVSDKPSWIRARQLLSGAQLAALQERRRLEYETLGSIDDAMRTLVVALRQRGQLDQTVIVFLTDNGYSFGEHRWVTKSCPYEECVHTPLLIRFPSASSRIVSAPVSNVDIAPTIASIAGAKAPAMDGTSLLPLIDPLRWPPVERPPGVLIEMPRGGVLVPPWMGVRTRDFAYVEYPGTGERELYDLTGVLGPADPDELRNRAGDPAYARVQERLTGLLARLLP